MQLFIRDIAGCSHVFSASTPADIVDAVAQHAGLSLMQSRISYRSRDISSILYSTSLQDAGLHSGATLDVSARLRGGAPKKRCAFMALKPQSHATALNSAGVASTSTISSPAPAPAPAAPTGRTTISDPSSGDSIAPASLPPTSESTDAATSPTQASAHMSAPTHAPAPTEPIYERCSSAALRMVGDCPRCDKSHCSAHRLPENHNCPALAGFRKKAFDENRAKLEKEATHVSKISAF